MNFVVNIICQKKIIFEKYLNVFKKSLNFFPKIVVTLFNDKFRPMQDTLTN